MKKKKTNIGPRISDQTRAFLENNFESRGGGAELILEAFPPLYNRTIKPALAKLTAGEKSLLLDLHNAYAMTPIHLGQGVSLQVRDGIDLEGMDKKWGVDGPTLLTKLEVMDLFTLACIEIWATAFWQAGH